MLRVPISQNYLSRLNLMVLNPIFKWIKGFAKEKKTRDRRKKKKRKKGYYFSNENNVSHVFSTINYDY